MRKRKKRARYKGCYLAGDNYALCKQILKAKEEGSFQGRTKYKLLKKEYECIQYRGGIRIATKGRTTLTKMYASVKKEAICIIEN